MQDKMARKFHNSGSKPVRTVASKKSQIGSKKSSFRKIYSYSEERDPTLTHAQKTSKRFATRRNHRAKSNRTINGHNSGYHEIIPTDFFLKYLSVPVPDTKLIVANPVYIASRRPIRQSNYDIFKSVADGYRTDTARTILSSKDGRVAGHSGSNLKTENQAEAHDLLRSIHFRMLTENITERDVSIEKVIKASLNAITVTSIAPGEYARTINGGTKKLRDQNFKSQYEAARNEMKEIVESNFATLNLAEKRIVQSFSNDYMDSVKPVSGIRGRSNSRFISSGRSTSPIRRVTLVNNEVSGGKYSGEDTTIYSLGDVTDIGKALTSLMRAERY